MTKRRFLIERPPPQSPAAEDAAAALLASLLADDARFLDSATVGRALSGNPTHPDPKKVATEARKRKETLGVWDGHFYRYPVFQFDAQGQPLPEVPGLIDVLPRDAEGSWRDAALWLFGPDAALDGGTPAELFVRDPARVIALARARRVDD